MNNARVIEIRVWSESKKLWEHLSFSNISDWFAYSEDSPITNNTWSLYIGKKDYSGLKIYEHQYLLHAGLIYLVVYDDQTTSYGMKLATGPLKPIHDNVRIVGDIFTSPGIETIYKLQK